MSRGSIPLALIIALSLAGKGHALGLGDIRVDSALNEPLSAQIEIIGATADELRLLQAKIAAREVFQKFGADRPAFLSSATFKIAADRQGRPVLDVRSADAFTEPVVSLLIDLTWGRGELIREFPLLLDPAESRQVTRAVEPPLVAARARIVHAATRPNVSPSEYRVAIGDTLRVITQRHGSHAPTDVQRTMIAIFRMNPDAFVGNINRLRLGATLKLPAPEAIAAISADEAAGEVRTQMTAWRKPASPAPVSTASPIAPVVSREPANEAQPAVDTAAVNDLKSRVRELELALKGVNEQIGARTAAIQALERRAAVVRPKPVADFAPKTQPSLPVRTSAQAPAASARRTAHGGRSAAPIVMLLALLILGFALLRKRSFPAAARAVEIKPAADQTVTELAAASVGAADGTPAAAAAAADEAPAPIPTPVAAAASPSQTDDLEVTTEMAHESDLLEQSLEDSLVTDADTLEPDLKTMILDARRSFPRPVDSTELDYDLNVLDLDSTAQHVEMPSNLSDRAVVSERRTNIADVLKNAIERDPTRRDLLMKLLETYHSEASTNRRAFLEVARKVSWQRDSMSADEWSKIMAMGREIAADDPLFADTTDDGDLANCA